MGCKFVRRFGDYNVWVGGKVVRGWRVVGAVRVFGHRGTEGTEKALVDDLILRAT